MEAIKFTERIVINENVQLILTILKTTIIDLSGIHF
jgi:hypothetical protein